MTKEKINGINQGKNRQGELLDKEKIKEMQEIIKEINEVGNKIKEGKYRGQEQVADIEARDESTAEDIKETEDINNEANKEIDQLHQEYKEKLEDLELRKQEIYQEGEDNVEEYVGAGDFEYRKTPSKEKNVKTEEDEPVVSGEIEEDEVKEKKDQSAEKQEEGPVISTDIVEEETRDKEEKPEPETQKLIEQGEIPLQLMDNPEVRGKSIRYKTNYLKLKEKNQELSDQEIDDFIKWAEMDEKKRENIESEVMEFIDTLGQDTVNEDEINGALRGLAAKTGIPAENEVDRRGNIIRPGLRSILDNQQEFVSNIAQDRARQAVSRRRRIAGAAGRILLYGGAGVGIAVSTGGVGALAMLGLGSLSATRILERVRSGQADRQRFNEAMADLRREINESKSSDEANIYQELSDQVYAQIETIKQEQIDNRDVINYELDEELEEAEDTYINEQSAENRQRIEELRDRKKAENYSTMKQYLEDRYVSDENDDKRIREAYSLYDIDEEDNLRERATVANRPIFRRMVDRLDQALGSRWLRGGESVREKGVTAAFFTGVGLVAREIPGVRRVLMGYAGMKGADAASLYATSRMERYRILRRIQHNEINPEAARETINLARTQLLDERFRNNNPVEYAQLRKVVDRYEQSSIERAERIDNLLTARNNQIETTITEKTRLENERKLIRTGSQVAGGVAGAMFGPELAKEALDWMKEKSSFFAGGRSRITEELERPKFTGKIIPPAEKPGDDVIWKGPRPKAALGAEDQTAAYERWKFAEGKVTPEDQTAAYERWKFAEGKVTPDIDPKQFELSTIRKGEGIEHALIRQLEENPKAFGYDKDINDAAAVKAWAGKEAHRLAIRGGYVDAETGQEVRVGTKGIDNVAYVLKNDGHGQATIEEYFKGEDGQFGSNPKEAHELAKDFKSAQFEKDIEKNYEYHHAKEVSEPVAPTGKTETVDTEPADKSETISKGKPGSRTVEIKDLRGYLPEGTTYDDFVDKGFDRANPERIKEAGMYLNDHPQLGNNIERVRTLMDIRDLNTDINLGLENIDRYYEAFKSLPTTLQQRSLVELFLHQGDEFNRQAIANLFKGLGVLENSQVRGVTALQGGDQLVLHYDIKMAPDFDVIIKPDGSAYVDGPFGWDKQYAGPAKMAEVLKRPLAAMAEMSRARPDH